MRDLSFIIIFFIFVLSSILIIITLNYSYDPMNVYGHTHIYVKSKFHRFVNLGIFRQEKFSMAIFGTSTTENFHVEKIKEKYGIDTIKLSMNGATAFELNKAMNFF